MRLCRNIEITWKVIVRHARTLSPTLTDSMSVTNGLYTPKVHHYFDTALSFILFDTTAIEIMKTKNNNNMKKFYLSFFSLFVYAASIYSQLQVDSSGYVGIGVTEEILEFDEEDSICSPFTVCTAGISDAIANFQNTDRQYTITAYTERLNQQGNGTAVWGVSYVHNGNSEGVVGAAKANYVNSNSNYTIGVRGVSCGGYNSIGVYGGKDYGQPYNNFAGIYGTTNTSNPSFQYSGVYAGYFDGQVRATGPIYAQAFYAPSANPTGGGVSENTSFTTIGEDENVTDKLRNVSSFELQHSEQPTQTRLPNPAEEFLRGRDIQQLTKKELHQLDSICLNTPPTETHPLSSVNYGLDAEQLKAVFPKLVKQDKDGNYNINYIEMIPLLVKSINELSGEIARLKGEETTSKRAKSEATGIENTPTEVDMVRMDQNKPNPFSESTVISLNIPEKTQTAKIFIYDLSGKQVKSIPVAERGEINITVFASDLNAGMYIYSLVIDGEVSVTRRMIVSE